MEIYQFIKLLKVELHTLNESATKFREQSVGLNFAKFCGCETDKCRTSG